MNNNQLQLVNFEQAKRLKKVGFDWPTERYRHVNGGYLDDDADKYEHNWNTDDKRERGRLLHNDENAETDICSAPTIPLALKWMRDVKRATYNIQTDAVFDECGDYAYEYEIRTYDEDGCDDEVIPSSECYYPYESAESALLDELLKLIER